MALPSSFLDELRARTLLGALIGRKVKLARSGRNWTGCCPFHNEKTPSFYVYDDHFHCFGCGAHGDAISFVMQSQGAGFMEAVEQLASEAGLEVPKPSLAVAEVERRRHDLSSVLAAAQASYQRRLRSGEGRRALEYLQKRGLGEAALERFGLGWSGEGRGALAVELAGSGIGPELLVEAGLMRVPEEPGGRAADLFFNRIMFPINDSRGRAISFGGRTLGDGQPKYVNGPETALFQKRRSLYGADLAREAIRGGEPLLVVEGYMDVIALHEAGFGGAVAPLGTALTEEQLQALWRLSPEPVLCFDGDAAGSRAARRAAEIALPSLAPDRTLRFVSLPEKDDPDSFVRREGPVAFRAEIAGGRPLADALFQMEKEGLGLATPEQRAVFRGRLEAAASRIPDRALAGEYRRSLLGRYFEEQVGRRRRSAPARPPGGGLRPARPTGGDRVATERARILTGILLKHPSLVGDVHQAFSDLALPPNLARLRTALFSWAEVAEVLDTQSLADHLNASGLEAEAAEACSAVPVPLPACASPGAMPAEAEAGWWHIFGFLRLDRLKEEVVQAERACRDEMNQRNQQRLISLATVLRRVESGEPDGVELVA